MKAANKNESDALRRQAEKMLARDKKSQTVVHDSLALIHELQVHQIELEVQNEELRHSQAETESLRRKFEDLYDFAPVGYLTLDERGLIRESNLAAASCLGTTRDHLHNAHFKSFLDAPSAQNFQAFMNRALNSSSRQECKVKLFQKREKTERYALIEGAADCRDEGKKQVVRLALIDITQHERAEEALRLSKEELAEKGRHLEEMNIALKVILDQREKEKRNLEEGFSQNINGLILPYLEKIRKTGLNPIQKEYVQILETNLQEIVSPLRYAISSKLMQLSPAEIKIMNLVKQGLSIKSIATLLNISPRTVEFHRDSLRKKLGITDRRINLKTFLSTIE